MKSMFLLAFAALFVLGGPAIGADQSTRYSECASHTDGPQRLHCFDKLTTSLRGTTGNVFGDRMLGMTEAEQGRLLTNKIGLRCAVDWSFYVGKEGHSHGSISDASIWNARCMDGRTFAVAFSNSGAVVGPPISCDRFRAKTTYDCFQSGKSQPGPMMVGKYRHLSIEDMKLDIKDLVGVKVSVTGLYSQIGDIASLGSELLDTTPVEVSVSELPRDQRRDLLRCPVTRQCMVKVDGTVRRSMLGLQVRADKAEVLGL